jgi:hypothetical protein
MKKKTFLLVALIIMGLNIISNAQITSVANGNWSNPSTWGGVPPTPGTDVIINHTVVLDIDYGYSSGSITVNASGALNGNSATRGLAVSGGTLTVSGSLNIPRLALFGGIVTNSGTFINDSLFVATTLTNNATGGIIAAQFFTSTGAVFTNAGGILAATNFLNISTVTNSGSITATDLMNSKSFTNEAAGVIHVTYNFHNADSLASPAIFTNNGVVKVDNDWSNSAEINGSGRFCVQNLTSNTGTMNGTFDFCDQSGGNIDANLGTIAGTITYCTIPCDLAVSEIYSNNQVLKVYPVPSNSIITIEMPLVDGINQITVYSETGGIVNQQKSSEKMIQIDMSRLTKGFYFLKVQNNDKIRMEKIVIQ